MHRRGRYARRRGTQDSEPHFGASPIRGKDDRLHGIITDRDIVVKCIASGRDPQTVTARELAEGTPIGVDAQADISEVLRPIEQNAIRRLPVLDSHRLIGMISEADPATHLSEHEVCEFAIRVLVTADQLSGCGGESGHGDSLMVRTLVPECLAT